MLIIVIISRQQIAAATLVEAATTRVRVKTQIYVNFLAKENHKFTLTS